MNTELTNKLIEIASRSGYKVVASYKAGVTTTSKHVISVECERYETYERWGGMQNYHEYTLKFEDGTCDTFNNEDKWCYLSIEEVH